jgi:hypothetical protein
MGAVCCSRLITVETEGGDPIGSIAWKPLIIITGSVVMFGFILPKLGMILVAADAGDPGVGAGR